LVFWACLAGCDWEGGVWLGQAVSRRVRARGARVLMVFFMVGLFGMRQSEIFAKLQRQPEI